MNRWNLEKIVLYSNHGNRRDIEFTLKKVNIITGASNSGKSAVIENIDYCLGSTQCHLPEYVRRACVWVGIVWVYDSTKVLLCREVPTSDRQKSDNYHYSVGMDISIPQTSAQISINATKDGAITKFEQQLGIGQIKSEVFGSQNRSGKNVSLRSITPFLFQSDEVIINKIALLRGMQDDRKQTVIDTLPYFLGVVDEKTIEKEQRLRHLQGLLKRAEREQEELDRLVSTQSERARQIIAEGAELGLVTSEDIESQQDYGSQLQLLERIGQWAPGKQATVGTSRTVALYGRDEWLVNELGRLRLRLKEAKMQVGSVSDFGKTAQSQYRRLEVIDFFGEATEGEMCPLCQHKIDEPSNSIATLKHAMSVLRSDMAEVQRERPQIDDFILRLEDEIRKYEDERKEIRGQLEAIVRESANADREMGLNDRRNRIVGKASLFLDAQQSQNSDLRRKNLLILRQEIEELKSEVDPTSKLDALTSVERRITYIASQLIKELPFDRQYHDCPINCNLRTLTVSLDTAQRRVAMRDVGSDENYLSLHVVLLLALHRVLGERNRPVPGVLIFDQLSRPYFPPDKVKGEVVMREQDEREQVKRYFDLLFNEVERGTSLQVIVLEHAYFPDDPRFVSATKERWVSDNKLVPLDWPLR